MPNLTMKQISLYFESRQGIEYGNYEMYQGEKYSPNELEKSFCEKSNGKKIFIHHIGIA